METLIINQQTKINYTRNLQQVIKRVVNTMAQTLKLTANTEVSIMIVDNDYIQELNFIYRGHNMPTDVLSFAMNELGEEEPDFDFSGEVNVLGDIVVSLEKAQEQSQEYGHSLERELGYLVAHGMLHLLGYDHETEEERKLMRDLEEKIMSAAKLER
ncbi:MAG: rRNA maturation RNase YbeY [Syntrophomonadaceae bacterium]|jgi:probable rRNA maturation factor|nr:rRNA maturation RNase YbeY [Bacillota bacterium]NLM88236.1 rRNA maturation RNase YbeY [Syntrophomonadaceae bacterium]HAA08256.1 rRNA maturation RNase YbeY [Syntrophomonas sp.]